MPKVLIIDGGPSYYAMFDKMGWKFATKVEDADLVQFTGGADVTPSYYGQVPHPTTSSDAGRDKREALIFNKARKLGKPMAGICRGGQFLHVLSGGTLFQHVHGHAMFGTHVAVTPDGHIFQVTSTHHQAMRDDCGEVLVVAETHAPQEFMDEDGTIALSSALNSVESVYHANTKAFCFQPHPEMDKGKECCVFYFSKLAELFGLGA